MNTMDLFDERRAQVMLIGREEPAFDSPEYLFELKLDGDRCLAYLDGGGTELVNRRGHRLLSHVPELASMHRQVRERCILDGELIIGSGMKRGFEQIRSRFATANRYRLERLSRENPATFVAYDMLYLKDRDVLRLPLTERKGLMESNIAENAYLAASRYIEGKGAALYELAVAQGMEGVVGKRRESAYRMGKRSNDWVKFKNWAEDDFIVYGWFPSDKADVVSLVLCQFREDTLIYKGHVVLGRNSGDFRQVEAAPRRETPAVFRGPVPEKRHKTVWLEPVLVCKVAYLCLTATGGLRQPVYRGLREDKRPEDCIAPDSSTWPHGC